MSMQGSQVHSSQSCAAQETSVSKPPAALVSIIKKTSTSDGFYGRRLSEHLGMEGDCLLRVNREGQLALAVTRLTCSSFLRERTAAIPSEPAFSILHQLGDLERHACWLAGRPRYSGAFGAGLGRSAAVACSSPVAGGVFSGFGVSSSSRADLDLPAFLVLRETSFDFFDFGLGVGVWWRFDFDDAPAFGVSRGVGRGVAPSSSSDFGFAL